MAKKTTAHVKPKRQTLAERRRGSHVVDVTPTNLDPAIYKIPETKRHRGPSTAKAVAGTGRTSAANAK